MLNGGIGGRHLLSARQIKYIQDAQALLLNKETKQGTHVKFQENVNPISSIGALIETTLKFHTKT